VIVGKEMKGGKQKRRMACDNGVKTDCSCEQQSRWKMEVWLGWHPMSVR
jgi:hypothetical protein